MSHTVIGIFNSTPSAMEAKQYLLANGYRDEDVDISVPQVDRNEPSAKRRNEDGRNEDYTDSVGDFFDDLFGNDENEASRHTEAGRQGTIVTVHARSVNEATAAAKALDRFGATDINDQDRQNQNNSDSNRSDTNIDSIPVIEEELQVGKREVESGGVRLRSRIIEKPVEKKIRLRSEHITVERNTVDRPATEEDFNAFREGTAEVTEHREVPVVSKDSRVVEEVNISKDAEEKEETIIDNVRRTRVETDEFSEEENDRNPRSRG